jgi:hypothetical protein
LNTLEAAAKETLASAEQRYVDLLSGVESRTAQLPDTASAEDVDRITAEVQPRIDSLEAEVTAAKRRLDSAERITRARDANAHLIPQANAPKSASLLHTTRAIPRGAGSRIYTRPAIAVTARRAAGCSATTRSSRRASRNADWRLRMPSSGRRLPRRTEVPAYTAPTDAVGVQTADGQLVMSNRALALV